MLTSTDQDTSTAAAPKIVNRGSNAEPTTSWQNDITTAGAGRSRPTAATIVLRSPARSGNPTLYIARPSSSDVRDGPTQTARAGEVVAVGDRVELAQPEDRTDDARSTGVRTRRDARWSPTPQRTRLHASLSADPVATRTSAAPHRRPRARCRAGVGVAEICATGPKVRFHVRSIWNGRENRQFARRCGGAATGHAPLPGDYGTRR